MTGNFVSDFLFFWGGTRARFLNINIHLGETLGMHMFSMMYCNTTYHYWKGFTPTSFFFSFSLKKMCIFIKCIDEHIFQARNVSCTLIIQTKYFI